MNTNTASTEDNIRDEIADWEMSHHMCDDEGFGCEIEEFKGTWPGATGVYYRCKLKRESLDEIFLAVHRYAATMAREELDIQRRALEWLLSDDTGISSETLCAHMLGLKCSYQSPPSDADDRGRCVRLLKKIPEWIPRLHEMADEQGQTSFVIDNAGLRQEHNSWRKQIPFIEAALASPDGEMK